MRTGKLIVVYDPTGQIDMPKDLQPGVMHAAITVEHIDDYTDHLRDTAERLCALLLEQL